MFFPAFAGPILLSDFVHASPAGLNASYYGVSGYNETFFMLQDLETFQSAQSSCNNWHANLASAASPGNWSAITQLIQDFWYGSSPAATMYASGPPYASPYVGMNNTGLQIDLQVCIFGYMCTCSMLLPPITPATQRYVGMHAPC